MGAIFRDGRRVDVVAIDNPDFVANTAARHVQGTDLGLDTGGTNPVTAATIKGHVDVVAGNPHGTTYSDVGAEPANANIQTHIGTVTGNPHAVTKTEVGLGNVTDDSQLKRAAGDIASFTEKTNPNGDDLVLVEDSADSNAKKKLKLSNLVAKLMQESLLPEFSGCVLEPLSGSGTNSVLVTSEHEAGPPRRNFYRGTTGQAATQDTDLVVQVKLPDSWNGFHATQAIQWDHRVSGTPGATGIELRVYDAAGTLANVAAKQQNTSWATVTLTAANLAAGTFAGGDVITLAFRVYADQAKNADLGKVLLKFAA